MTLLSVISSKMRLKKELDLAIEKFLNDGGEITRLCYASEEEVKLAQRMRHHLDRQDNSERSKKFVEKVKQKEAGMIFSRDERNSV